MSKKITSHNAVKKLFLGKEMNEFVINFLTRKSTGLVSELRRDVIIHNIKPKLDNLRVTSDMLYYPTPYQFNEREDDYLIEVGREIGIRRRIDDYFKVPEVYNIQTIARLRSEIRHPLVNEVTEQHIFENSEEEIIAQQIIKSVNNGFRFMLIDSGRDNNKILLQESYFSSAKNSKSIERRVNNILKAKFLVEDFFREYDERIIQRAKEKVKNYLGKIKKV